MQCTCLICRAMTAELTGSTSTPYPGLRRTSSPGHPPSSANTMTALALSTWSWGSHGFSLHHSAHAVEFRKHHLSLLGLQHLTSKRRRRNLYPKLVVGNAEVWSDVCRLVQTVELLFPRLHFRCVVLHEMSVEVQAQVIAEATIHVWLNGKWQYPHLCFLQLPAALRWCRGACGTCLTGCWLQAAPLTA